ncbi:hypothetical protein K469DRAFT_768193 [Zopfia rhizophila CBS 207.26]|uniref:C2H2-type domain-containing protein n=1 Tax=Zopfia rhizophila CBS 207.26 TaxID=1314779 RepID=A0A6A6D9Z1_9PEZI|nr:hypothetical protein K469DRAFT_768193 [Zopfia rhizophila CBS 207.26]
MHPLRVKRSSARVTPPGKSGDDFQLDPDEEALEAAKVSVYKEKRPRICFVCLGNENLPMKQRIYSFHASGDRNKRFKRKHLTYVKKGESIQCDLCQVNLDNKMLWQRHAYEVHGTVSLSAA